MLLDSAANTDNMVGPHHLFIIYVTFYKIARTPEEPERRVIRNNQSAVFLQPLFGIRRHSSLNSASTGRNVGRIDAR